VFLGFSAGRRGVRERCPATSCGKGDNKASAVNRQLSMEVWYGLGGRHDGGTWLRGSRADGVSGMEHGLSDGMEQLCDG
jgi:hypothetical protein